ncbi:Peptidyl-Prolyl Cis-Trans Isomerase Fkbp8 [Manis pentadactyla]|nr:Peptidyl-Prolyl Cis-Trans Isomerase Fkbp8 [Manis pentadactyla]
MYLLDLAYKKTIRDMPGLNDQKSYLKKNDVAGKPSNIKDKKEPVGTLHFQVEKANPTFCLCFILGEKKNLVFTLGYFKKSEWIQCYGNANSTMG